MVVLTYYFLAIAKHPEVQKKAWAEMDAVVGKDRLPTFTDRESLPYVEAICKELFRWMPIIPLGKLLVPMVIIALTLYFKLFHIAPWTTMYTLATTFLKIHW